MSDVPAESPAPEERPEPPVDPSPKHAGEGGGAEVLLYDELRRLARQHLARERAGHTLDPTALVHEAWLRIDSGAPVRGTTRASYLALASRVMRSVLVDHARRRKARKRDSGGERVTLSLVGARRNSVDVLELHDAFERLEKLDGELARIAEMHVFGGMSQREVAEVLGIPLRTLERRWKVASTWLRKELGP